MPCPFRRVGLTGAQDSCRAKGSQDLYQGGCRCALFFCWRQRLSRCDRGHGRSCFRDRLIMKLTDLWELAKAHRVIRRDPLLSWIIRVSAAEVDYCDVCGETDPDDLQRLIDKRILDYSTNHLKKKGGKVRREKEASGEPDRIEQERKASRFMLPAGRTHVRAVRRRPMRRTANLALLVALLRRRRTCGAGFDFARNSSPQPPPGGGLQLAAARASPSARLRTDFQIAHVRPQSRMSSYR